MSRDMMPSFELYQPDTVEGAAKLAKDVEKSWLLAGGQDSYDWFKDRAKHPEALIDLGGISALKGIRGTDAGVEIGALTTLTEIAGSELLKANYTVLARAASYPGREFQGVVRSVGSRVDPVTRAIQVRAHVPNDDSALRPGMLLMVEVVMTERMALIVPENAVYQIQDRAYVYVVDDNLIARERLIETGDRRYGSVEVLSGLEAGERIVVEGIVKLRNGIAVRLTED